MLLKAYQVSAFTADAATRLPDGPSGAVACPDGGVWRMAREAAGGGDVGLPVRVSFFREHAMTLIAAPPVTIALTSQC